ncbi:MAG: hypothetical protein P9M14_03250 [Candidatus Alcyoniella australis]|nr:hypothetical protein [Candidatus Alcyoniella australis]
MTQQTLEQVKRLHGLLPICSKRKSIRDDQGYWRQVETFTHGLCPTCLKELYPELDDDKS